MTAKNATTAVAGKRPLMHAKLPSMEYIGKTRYLKRKGETHRKSDSLAALRPVNTAAAYQSGARRQIKSLNPTALTNLIMMNGSITIPG